MNTDETSLLKQILAVSERTSARVSLVADVQKGMLTEEKAEKMMVRIAENIFNKGISTHADNCKTFVIAQKAKERSDQNTGMIKTWAVKTRDSLMPSKRGENLPKWAKIVVPIVGAIITAIVTAISTS